MRESHTVLHVGPDHREPGGMAHVIQSYLEARLDPWRVEAVPSYSARSRLHWLWRLVTSTGVIAFASRRRVRGIHLHASERFDLVRTLVLLEIARRRRIPRVVTLHGAQFMKDVARRPRLVRAMLRRADVVTALSPEVEAAARDLGARRVVHLPNPVHVRAAPVGVSERTQVLFAGEIGRRKGVDVLVDAWPAVHTAHPDASLLLVGPVAEPELIASLPSGARYGGVLDRAEVAAALDASSVAVLPSRAEAMPMFILEAMGAGVPVVGTPVGSVAAVIDGAGLVVPVGDAAALAGALTTLLGDARLLEEMSRKAHASAAAGYSTEIFERRVGELYAATFGGYISKT